MSAPSNNEPLVRYVFAGAAVDSLDANQSLSVLRELGERGQRNGVTGVLLGQGRDFMQVLEGPRSEVESLYLSVALDRRQHRLVKLLDEPLSEREFADLSLSYGDACQSVFKRLQDNRELGSARGQCENDPANAHSGQGRTLADGRVERLMLQFSEGRWRRSKP